MTDITPTGLDNVVLTHRKEGFFLDSIGYVAVLKFKYVGDIKVTLSKRYPSGLSSNECIIAFTEPLEQPFMTIEGDFTLSSIFAYGFDGKEKQVKFVREDDKMQTLSTEWDSSDSKYEDLNYSSNQSRVRKSTISFIEDGIKTTYNNKGKRIRSK